MAGLDPLEPHVPADPVARGPPQSITRRLRSGSATVSRTRTSGRGADPCERRRRRPAGSYQRLEFLGDRVLGLAVADMLYRGLPGGARGRPVPPPVRARAPGDLRRGRAALGCWARTSSSAAARSNRAGAATRRSWPMSAKPIIGAVFLDGGYAAARALVERSFGDRAARRDGPCAIRRAPCRNGRKAGACRRRPTRSWSRSAPTMRRSSGSWSRCRARRRPRPRRLEAGGGTRRRPQPSPARGRVDGGSAWRA